MGRRIAMCLYRRTVVRLLLCTVVRLQMPARAYCCALLQIHLSKIINKLYYWVCVNGRIIIYEYRTCDKFATHQNM